MNGDEVGWAAVREFPMINVQCSMIKFASQALEH
jgi:hypothetical protein